MLVAVVAPVVSLQIWRRHFCKPRRGLPLLAVKRALLAVKGILVAVKKAVRVRVLPGRRQSAWCERLDATAADTSCGP